MPYVHRTTAWRRARPWLSAVAVVVLMLVALAGPAAAHSRSAVALVDASVSPRIARPTTTIKFAVTYRGADDRDAATVLAIVDGHPRTMHPTRLANGGMRYGLTTRLRVGHHWIRFEATGSRGGRSSVNSGTVWITSASAAGATRPGPGTPASMADSGAEFGGRTPAKSGTTGGAANDSDGPTSPADDYAPTADRPDAQSGALDGDRGRGPDTAAAAGVSDSGSSPTSSPDPMAALGAVGPPAAGGPGGDGSGELLGLSSPRGLDALGPGGSGGLLDAYFRVYPVLVTTGGTAVVWAAFIIFGKRRRDGEPPAPDAVLASHAASAIEPIPALELVPAAPRQLPPGVDPDEADLPRWRRPSLLQARKIDPLRTASVAVSLSFDGVGGGSARLIHGGERRQIRYRLVRLLDVPDESTGRELGVLDAGDEVEIVEAYGIYRLVVCPDGQRGWLHKMVLGDLVGQDAGGEPAPDGIDEDVLAAFLAARRQTA